MVRSENIATRLASLRRYLGLLHALRARPFSEIRADPLLQGGLERYLFLAAQASIDGAEMACVIKGFGRPESMTQGFALLEAAGVLPPALGESLRRMVGFRNALVHGYENLDYGIVEDALRVRIADIEEFAVLIERLLTD